ncbi:MAG TPA: isovaleryl-CoA dehydrogenase [Burkholderiaceae bacterium]|nr:isovaleryl-CoA dehydrogenase [Burkholderiaceae bacterium]HQR72281.1 isovaleryl-CoA dehydrogenase [Burkholderiaceae bacterium]
MTSTHEVFNQSTPFVDRNLYAIDAALQEGVARHGGRWADAELHALGARLGGAECAEWARLANSFPPQLRSFDRSGRRIDEVEFHPAWHEVMRLMIGAGVHADPWADPKPGAQVARAAKYLLFSQVENGAQCPVTMTYAVVPVMQRFAAAMPAIARDWLPRILSHDYDPGSKPVAAKRGALLGMGMTEKQGGSDVRTNTTFAEPDGHGEWGERYRITGHKWFFSAPQCDAHLVLAQTQRESAAGLSCFLLPRWRADGTRNSIAVQRLKDKVGNRSNASSEVEFADAEGWLVGEVGRGVPTILEMGTHTRLDCAIASAGILRALLTHALHHARERSAFGHHLAEQPLMRNVLADLALESEAATLLALRLARAFDGRHLHDEHEALMARVLTPVAKYWICKRLPAAAAEAMEVMGGNGYVEEGPFARFYREAPLNSIWEGSGNVMCLDVLRALSRVPAVRDALASELRAARGAHRSYDAYVDELTADLDRTDLGEAQARALTERIALAVQAALLISGGPSAVADAFCASRLVTGWGRTFGVLPATIDPAPLLLRALPN